jgi:sugar lactone lactonase YvrE
VRLLKYLLMLTLLLLLALAGTVKLRYGGGEAFPDRHTEPALLPETALEVVANLPSPPGNIAVSADGRVFISVHPEAHPALKVVELINGQMVPFPNLAYQNGSDAQAFDNVLGIRLDAQRRLWTLDNGTHGIKPARLLAFDIGSGRLVHQFTFPRELAGLGSHLNDLQVAPDGRFIYIADASFFAKTPAIVVYDVEQRRARRVLQGHASVNAERYVPVVQGRRMEVLGLLAIRPGVDSIALDATGEWLYFAPVTNLDLYRVRSADLRNQQLSADQLAARVETYAAKTMSDGITMDLADNIYLSDLEHSAVVRLRTDKTMETLVQSPRLRWPDGFSFGPDGWLYLTCSSLQYVIGLPPSSVTAHAPYQVFRFKPGVPGTAGH